MHRQKKEEENNCVENLQLQFRQCFSWLILPFSTPISATAECDGTRLGWLLSTVSWDLVSQSGSLPLRRALLPQARHTGRGGRGTPPPLIELGPIQTQIKGSIRSHAPGCKMITHRSQSRTFPQRQAQSWGIPWEFPAVWDISC